MDWHWEGARRQEPFAVGAKSSTNMWVRPTITLKVGGPLFLKTRLQLTTADAEKARQTHRNKEIGSSLWLSFYNLHNSRLQDGL